jgi:cyclohexane-1-carbonyl-CoA dehydrogenase
MTQISEEQKIMLDNLRRAVKEKVAPDAAEKDRTGRFNPEIASLFWDLGLLGIMLPEEFGGWPHNPSFTLTENYYREGTQQNVRSDKDY